MLASHPPRGSHAPSARHASLPRPPAHPHRPLPPPRSAAAAAAEPVWWPSVRPSFVAVESAEAITSLLSSAPRDALVTLAWLSPSCKHCEAAAALVAEVAGSLSGGAPPQQQPPPAAAAKPPVVFAACLASTSSSRAAAAACGVAAFPLLQLYRNGALLLEMTPSQRGGTSLAAMRLRNALHVVNSDTRAPAEVHFVLQAGEVSARDGPALAPKAFSYAQMRAAAVAAYKAEQARLEEEIGEGEVGDECDSKDTDEDCVVKW